MTVEFCGGFCSLGGFPYFGVQHRRQCFCGRSYGHFGKSNETDCKFSCLGNSKQECGGHWRNSVFALTYPTASSSRRCPASNLPTSWSIAAQTALDCLIPCEASADCQAVIFSGQQRLCHLLRFAYPPASLSSTDGDFLFAAESARSKTV
uniref:WSC domain-containing protein n=1 Tax=Macrostomum lignano TaxID=282301 RepID=A0A1I8HUC0_9PLAT